MDHKQCRCYFAVGIFWTCVCRSAIAKWSARCHPVGSCPTVYSTAATRTPISGLQAAARGTRRSVVAHLWRHCPLRCTAATTLLVSWSAVLTSHEPSPWRPVSWWQLVALQCHWYRTPPCPCGGCKSSHPPIIYRKPSNRSPDLNTGRPILGHLLSGHILFACRVIVITHPNRGWVGCHYHYQLDSNLSFKDRIAQKINIAYRIMLGIIKTNFIYLDESSFILLYKPMVHPHLEYANSVWCRSS